MYICMCVCMCIIYTHEHISYIYIYTHLYIHSTIKGMIMQRVYERSRGPPSPDESLRETKYFLYYGLLPHSEISCNYLYGEWMLSGDCLSGK